MDGKNWEKQVYPSLSHFGREKQVLDGKNPTLHVGDNELTASRCGSEYLQFKQQQKNSGWHTPIKTD